MGRIRAFYHRHMVAGPFATFLLVLGAFIDVVERIDQVRSMMNPDYWLTKLILLPHSALVVSVIGLSLLAYVIFKEKPLAKVDVATLDIPDNSPSTSPETPTLAGTRSERQNRRNERVRVQIEKLYRPLYFLSSQNETLFELVGRIHGAYGAEYSSKNWSPSEHTQANVKKDTEMTIQIANSYVAIARENSTAMVDILKSNYEHIDPEDEEVFRQFVLDQTRLKQEFPAEGPIKIPFRVYKHVGEISYMRPDFSDRVRDKFLAKKKELEG